MNDKKILANAMRRSELKQADLVKHFGVNKSTVSTNLRRDRMSLDVFTSYLNAMGYSIMVGEKDGDTFIPLWELEKDEE